MKESAKARRLKRHHRRNKHQSKMNLVSLMDIFTILVFFLTPSVRMSVAPSDTLFL
ncbi:MAG: hypothetical protein ACTHV7_12730 [Oleiphilaceae bacterium]